METTRTPGEWLHDLLTAFEQDVTVRRYATFDDVLAYCRYSANPVGRLILHLFGYQDPQLFHWSDCICTGLQLANHWQDVAIDFAKNRVYLPQEDLNRWGVSEEMLQTARVTQSFRDLMRFQVNRTRRFFKEGAPLPQQVKGRLQWELALTWQGGMRVLEKIEECQYDVFHRRPVVTRWDWGRMVLHTLGRRVFS